MLRDQFVQSGDPRDAVRQPPDGESLAGFVHEMDVVTGLGPVVGPFPPDFDLDAAWDLCLRWAPRTSTCPASLSTTFRLSVVTPTSLHT